MLPIETVVELLMKSAVLSKKGWHHVTIPEVAESLEDLRSKVRAYLETLAENANAVETAK